MALCRHCGTKKANRPLGLCYKCYYTPGMRKRYPSTSKFGPCNDEPSQEELDAIIAEQSQCLPPWWEAETERIRQHEEEL